MLSRRQVPRDELASGLAVCLGGLMIGLVGWVADAGAQGSAVDLPRPATAGPPHRRGREEFTVGRAASAIRVDGVLDEEAWGTAMLLPLAFETSPGNNTPARVETKCFVAFDAAKLFLGCEAFDSDPRRIRAYITDRDRVDGQDRVGFTIDPFNDARRAFEFGITALGVQSDGIVHQRREGTDLSWDAIWSSAGRISDRGYVVEAAIPFRSLRFPNTAEVQTWGLFAWRQWPRSENVEFRSMHLDRDNGCMLCQANLVSGFEGLSPGINLELVPTVTSSRTDTREDIPDGRLEAGSIEGEPGLDLRWGITSDLAWNSTINPDFSQVEADVAQLDVNNRFALFFPEKRPFFLEGADFFDTPIQAVFTRTISDPTLGTKLTGKLGSNAVGALVARDRVTNLVFPGNQGSTSATLDQGLTSVVARFRRDVGSSSTIGVLYAGREGSGYSNRVGGVDAFYRPWDALTVQAQYLRAHTDYPDGIAADEGQEFDGFGGDAFQSQVVYSTRNWRVQGSYRTLDAGFRADAGFVNQVDVRGVNLWGQRRFWGHPGGWYTRLVLNAGAWRDESIGGRLTNDGVWANVYYEGPLQTAFWINPDRTREYFQGEIHTLNRIWTGWSIRPIGSVGFDFQFNAGDAVDFANARKAFQVQFNPSLALRLGRHIDLNVSHRFQRMATQGEKIFTANLSQLRTVYNFNPRTFVRAIVQYRRTDRNPALYRGTVDREQSNVFAQLLFSYKVNPQTVAFVGYSDDRVGSTDENLRTIPLTQSSRTFFLKLGYAWRP